MPRRLQSGIAKIDSTNGDAKAQRVRFDVFGQNVAERVDPAESETDLYVGLEHLDPECLEIRRYGTPSDVTGQKLRFKKTTSFLGGVARINVNSASPRPMEFVQRTRWLFVRFLMRLCRTFCRSLSNPISSWSGPSQSPLDRCLPRSTGKLSELKSLSSHRRPSKSV